MTKHDANRILDRIREGYPVSLAITTKALQRTGDISGLPDKPLCSDGNEPCHDRAEPMESKGIEEGFSYSRYLDFKQTEGITQ